MVCTSSTVTIKALPRHQPASLVRCMSRAKEGSGESGRRTSTFTFNAPTPLSFGVPSNA